MSVLKVARIGHPIVRAEARDVPEDELRSAEVQRLIDDMAETMRDYDGVGLAAPQVHVGLRLAVIEVPAEDVRVEGGVPFTVLVNPRLAPVGEERLWGWEGCLSVPDLRGLVRRWARLRLEALDRRGEPYTVEASGFFARVIQHECDHLDGRVYLDRMEDLRSLSFQKEFETYAHPHPDEES